MMWDSAERTGTEAQQQGHEGARGVGVGGVWPPETQDQHASRDMGGTSRADPAGRGPARGFSSWLTREPRCL